MEHEVRPAPGQAPGGVVDDAAASGSLLRRLGVRLRAISRRIAAVEALVAGLLILAIFCLLMGNVVSRAIARPLIWSDELAIYLMACAAFVGASVGLAHRQHIAVTLLPDLLSLRNAHRLAIVVDVILLAFFVVLAVLLWRWFDPVGVLRAESLEAYSMQTFNFMWQEPTVTLGMRKVWFWMVLPVFCLTGGLHVAGSLVERLSGQPGEQQ